MVHEVINKKYLQINKFKSKCMYRSHPNNLQSTTKQKLIKPLGIIENYKNHKIKIFANSNSRDKQLHGKCHDLYYGDLNMH